MKWLRKLFGQADSPRSIQADRQKESNQNQEVSVRIEVGESPKKKPVFKSDKVKALLEHVRPISHPEYPFLDTEYSPSSLMPAADYTKWVSSRLREDDWESLKEFLDFITYEHQLTALEKTFRDYSFSEYIHGDQELLLELKTIAILCYRIPWTGRKESQTHLLSELYLHALACHPFEIPESALEYLQRGANNLIRKQNKESEEYGISFKRETVKIAELRQNRVFTPSSIGLIFKEYPVTFRACIGYSLERGSPVSGTIRPQLQGEYGLRQFGLSGKENAEFIDATGVFTAPSDLAALAKRLQKKELQEIGSDANIELLKSWKKDKMIDLVLESSTGREMVAKRASKELIAVVEEKKEDFDSWCSDIASLKNIALCLATA